MGNFKELHVWQASILLCEEIYKITQTGSFSKDFGLRDQVRRAAVSVASNIAEGDESGTNNLSVRYFSIAKGSCAELLTQMIIAERIGYISKEELAWYEENCNKISAMLYNLIKARKS